MGEMKEILVPRDAEEWGSPCQPFSDSKICCYKPYLGQLSGSISSGPRESSPHKRDRSSGGGSCTDRQACCQEQGDGGASAATQCFCRPQHQEQGARTGFEGIMRETRCVTETIPGFLAPANTLQTRSMYRCVLIGAIGAQAAVPADAADEAAGEKKGFGVALLCS